MAQTQEIYEVLETVSDDIEHFSIEKGNRLTLCTEVVEGCGTYLELSWDELFERQFQKRGHWTEMN